MFSSIHGVYQTFCKWPGDRSFEFSDTTSAKLGDLGGFVLTENAAPSWVTLGSPLL